MTYVKEIPKPKCQTCRRPATHEVFNHRNSSLGTFCRVCSQSAHRRQQEHENELPRL